MNTTRIPLTPAEAAVLIRVRQQGKTPHSFWEPQYVFADSPVLRRACARLVKRGLLRASAMNSVCLTQRAVELSANAEHLRCYTCGAIIGTARECHVCGLEQPTY